MYFLFYVKEDEGEAETSKLVDSTKQHNLSNDSEKRLMQSCLDTTINKKSEQAQSNDPTSMQTKMQADIDEIKKMLGDMYVTSSKTKTLITSSDSKIKEANNLLELSAEPDIKVEINENGCRVQCLVCNALQQSNYLEKVT